MNNILYIKGQFYQKGITWNPVKRNLPAGQSITSEVLQKLKNELQSLYEYWQTEPLIRGALVSVYYKHVVAKSNRLKGLLCVGSSNPNDSVCGSKFFGDDDKVKHVFVHYVGLDVLRESIVRLGVCIAMVETKYNGRISSNDIEKFYGTPSEYTGTELSRTTFVNIILDAHYVEKFCIDREVGQISENSIVTLYKTDVKTSDLLRSLGIDMIPAKIMSETTVRLTPTEIKLLCEKAPYLIAMSTHDITKLTLENLNDYHSSIMQIPPPQQEPTIGVIDTPFYEETYFNDWVSYTSMLDKNITVDAQDFHHGTAVTSIIVDGPAFNPWLDDGCGRFKVKHFGVATNGVFSSFSILKAIREIIAANREIKVWNLSLGSIVEINQNFISPEAAELDRIQCEYDVVFVVAGTNKLANSSNRMRIGAPADSINSIVVNAVDSTNNPVSYHRTGPVLSFFHKPDVSCFGGDDGQEMHVWTPSGERLSSGTSFAAPWISRKMAYLIHKMGFTREIAKALLIDSAAGWERKDDKTFSIGYGIVPKRIEDIIQTSNNEIRFIMTGSTDTYETYAYNIPVPVYQGKHPFYARATLCYFPKCSREQGVDYTCTEMDIHFGRTKKEKDRVTISSINENTQGDIGPNYLKEGPARQLYRKWDNVKHISDEIKTRAIPRIAYEAGMWGINVRVKERLNTKSGKGLQFGVVVTLKEMNGVNRIDDFIKRCMINSWVVNQIEITNQFDIYTKAEEDITLE